MSVNLETDIRTVRIAFGSSCLPFANNNIVTSVILDAVIDVRIRLIIVISVVWEDGFRCACLSLQQANFNVISRNSNQLFKRIPINDVSMIFHIILEAEWFDNL